MSRIKEQSTLLQTKILLEHYRYIEYLCNLSKEEFAALIENSDPAIFSAFKNKRVEDILSIISLYRSLVKKTMRKIKRFFDSQEYKQNITKYKDIYLGYRILRMKHINKKEISNDVISIKLNINEHNFCRNYQNALRLFYHYFLEVLDEDNQAKKYNLNNVRIIALMKLDREAKIKRIAIA